MLKDLKPYPLTFAYLISASRGDTKKLIRVMKAFYHPGNYYLIHVDADAPGKEHKDIAEFVSSDPVFGSVGNVWKPNLVTYRGPTMLATTLHAMSILLRSFKCNWIFNLIAFDYPLITQDGMVSGPFHFCFIYTILFRSTATFFTFYWVGVRIIVEITF